MADILKVLDITFKVVLTGALSVGTGWLLQDMKYKRREMEVICKAEEQSRRKNEFERLLRE